MFGEQPAKAAPILILMFINVHHYFTDGVIWKISDPEVRKELFAHVHGQQRTTPAIAGPTSVGSSNSRVRRAKTIR
jgi:hypothetical protein